jgi:hypothetical protein
VGLGKGLKMYKNNFAASIKVYDSFIKESVPGEVTIPFGSEYTIYMRNRDSRDVKVNVSIDGVDVLDGSSLIIHGNSFAELRGFMKKNRIINRFKFIQKSKKNMKKHNRVDEFDDGTIRIEYQFTKKIEEKNILNTITTLGCWRPWWIDSRDYPFIYTSSNTKFGSTYSNSSIFYENVNGKESYSTTFQNSTGENFSFKSDSPPQSMIAFAGMDSSEAIKQLSSPKEDEGITVKGSKLNEKLKESWIGELESHKEVIVLILKGVNCSDSEKEEVNLFCKRCGAEVDPKDNYCGSCGNKLK